MTSIAGARAAQRTPRKKGATYKPMEPILAAALETAATEAELNALPLRQGNGQPRGPLAPDLDDLEIEGEEISTSITQTWTDQAIKCYLTKADCASCSIPKGNYSFTCQMNKVVPVLLKTLGAPDPIRLNKLLPYIHHY